MEKGYIVGSTFYKAGDENTEVSAVDITKQKKLYVVCVKGSAKIQTDGAIQYVSEGVTLNGSMAETPEGGRPILYLKGSGEKLFSRSARFPAHGVRKHCLKG